MSDTTAEFTAGAPTISVSAESVPVALIDAALTARIASAKRHLLEGGVLQPVEWGVIVPQDPPDPRGRKVYAYSEIDALIEEGPALDRGALSTERSDDIKLIILDPLAISDEHLFRWGKPSHTHRVKQVDGLIQNEENTRYFSEVTVIR